VGQLLTHPDSRLRAAHSNAAPAWRWPPVPAMLADLYDMQKSLIAAFGRVQLTAADLYPRPRLKPVEPEKVPTIAEFDVAGFMRQINS